MIGRVWDALWHRWYVTVPSLVLAAVLAGAAWVVVPPMYERTASQLLVPGAGTVPRDGNPYFYLSGLTQAADVIVRAVGSDNVVHEIDRSFTGVEIEVTRDPSTAGPVILISVNARSDADAAAVLAFMVDRTKKELEHLQASDNVAPSDRILVQSITVDQQGTLRQRTRLVATAAVGGIVAVLGLLLAALVDGVAARRRLRRTDRGHTDLGSGGPEVDDPLEPLPDGSGATQVDEVTTPVAGVGEAAVPGADQQGPEALLEGSPASSEEPDEQSDASDRDGLLDTSLSARRA